MIAKIKHSFDFGPDTTTFRYFPPSQKTNIYWQILDLFPMDFVIYCFAYGVDVVPLDRVTPTHGPIIDIVFVVNDTEGFHEINLKTNRNHYSGLKYFGSSIINTINEDYGGAMYVNTVPMKAKNVTLRYGIIYVLDFIQHISTWKTMYLPGRMLLPFVTLKKTYDFEINDAIEDNLVIAVHTALLLLPEVFTEKQFYETIVQLSYEGDFRFTLGQAKRKSKSIVEKQFQHFRNIYMTILVDLQEIDKQYLNTTSNTTWVQSVLTKHILFHLSELSSSTIICLCDEYKKIDSKARPVEAIKNISLYKHIRRAHLIRKCVSDLLAKSSYAQCVKDVFTGGVISTLYRSALTFAKKTKSYFFHCK